MRVFNPELIVPDLCLLLRLKGEQCIANEESRAEANKDEHGL